MSKPRNKKYQPKPVRFPAIIPLESVADVFPNKALELHAAIVTLIARPETEHCNNVTRQLCIIAGGLSHARGGKPLRGARDMAAIAVNSAILTIEAVIERTGKFFITEAEAQTLRVAAGKLDDAMRDMPMTAYRLAEREVLARESQLARVFELEAA